MDDGSFARFLDRSLVLQRRDVPTHAARLAEHLRGLRVRIGVDGEALDVVSDGAVVSVVPAGAEACVSLRTDGRAILRLVDGDRTLEDAVLGDEVELQGAVPQLVRFYDGLILYLQAAVRCPALVPLLQAFRVQNEERGA